MCLEKSLVILKAIFNIKYYSNWHNYFYQIYYLNTTLQTSNLNSSEIQEMR